MWLLKWSQLPQLFGGGEASAPACILSGKPPAPQADSTVDLQVRMQPSHTLSLLQMDCLQLQGAAVPLAHSRPALLAASAVPEQIFCILQRGEPGGTVPAASSISAECRLQHAEPSGAAVAACRLQKHLPELLQYKSCKG